MRALRIGAEPRVGFILGALEEPASERNVRGGGGSISPGKEGRRAEGGWGDSTDKGAEVSKCYGKNSENTTVVRSWWNRKFFNLINKKKKKREREQPESNPQKKIGVRYWKTLNAFCTLSYRPREPLRDFTSGMGRWINCPLRSCHALTFWECRTFPKSYGICFCQNWV